MAPAGVPKDIVGTLNALVVKIVGTPEIRELFTRQGLEPQTNTPEEFAELIRSDIGHVTQLIRSTGAKPQ
jgi:tripartite-type tricarboxylate transporter receptor subunit TctC